MLTINKTYCIDSNDRSATSIRLNKENGFFYNFTITNFNGNQIDLQLNEILANELFTALKELGNFM